MESLYQPRKPAQATPIGVAWSDPGSATMSSKWTKNSAVQQPPPVCHKGPDDLPVPPPPIYQRTLQAYVDVFFDITPGNFYVTALVQLYPGEPDTTWAGITNQGTQNVELEIFATPPYLDYRVELTALLGPAPVRNFVWMNVGVLHHDPFHLPWLTVELGPPQRRWTVSVTE